MYTNYFKQFIVDRNLGKSTVDGYNVVLKLYCDFNGMSLDDLMDEAFLEEEKISSVKGRSIRERLLAFRSFLIERKMSHSTVKTYFTRIKTFYRHFGVQIPQLPGVKFKSSYQLNYSDLPTKDDLARVLGKLTLDFKALVLFMSSSGTSKAESLSLTVYDFISACGDYCSGNDLQLILDELDGRRDIVPTIYLRRIKTDKYYFTFCSSEASYFIIKYLRSRDDLSFDDMLFPFSDSFVTRRFQEINDLMGWGRKGYYRFFRSHVLRKFHASNIGLPAEYVDALQGRSRSVVHEAYIKTNPERLRKMFVDHMSNVMIFPVNTVVEDEAVDEIHISINIFISDMQLSLD